MYLASLLLAQGGFRTTNWVEIAKAVIVICAVLAIAYAVIVYFKVPIPPVVWHILGIVVLCALAILAINFLASL